MVFFKTALPGDLPSAGLSAAALSVRFTSHRAVRTAALLFVPDVSVCARAVMQLSLSPGDLIAEIE